MKLVALVAVLACAAAIQQVPLRNRQFNRCLSRKIPLFASRESSGSSDYHVMSGRIVWAVYPLKDYDGGTFEIDDAYTSAQDDALDSVAFMIDGSSFNRADMTTPNEVQYTKKRDSLSYRGTWENVEVNGANITVNMEIYFSKTDFARMYLEVESPTDVTVPFEFKVNHGGGNEVKWRDDKSHKDVLRNEAFQLGDDDDYSDKPPVADIAESTINAVFIGEDDTEDPSAVVVFQSQESNNRFNITDLSDITMMGNLDLKANAPQAVMAFVGIFDNFQPALEEAADFHTIKSLENSPCNSRTLENLSDEQKARIVNWNFNLRDKN